MPGGEKKCEDCGETYHGGTDLSKYGCRCLKAKYTAAKANREKLGDQKPEASEGVGGDKPIVGGNAICEDCWGQYNKGTNLRLYGCPCMKAKLEAVFAEPAEGGAYCHELRCHEREPCPVHAPKAAQTASGSSSSTPPCCPPGGLPQRAAGSHVAKGKYKTIGDLEVYEVGESKSGMGLLVVQEIFGIHMGNLTEICDTFADQGFAVVMADFHRGLHCKDGDFSNFAKMLSAAPWSTVFSDITATLFPLLKAKGATRLGVLGFCYGSWVMMKLAGTGLIKAGAASHPSHPKIGPMVGDDVKALAEGVQCPVQIFTAGNDDALSKPGGQDEAIIKSKFPSSEFREFKDMNHGWVSRGDWEKDGPEFQQGREDALKSHLNFFLSNL